ncbi:hypothetical protein F3I62_01360 [Pseudomonas sp. R-28-1W-6]|uniref:hypothetical protein n=1 Tax=Pseudomonas sp. R-28-1W-6 TaxID=2650101 RepID=UPI00136603FC|nr:hypothetical protein [Pseudomonas sp. R-28-1W-6]MWV10727.1 hypothetical protein [Pseudomonas sp. R-28-1W-6]
MNTKHLMKKLPSCLLGAILAAGIASSTTVNAVDGNPPGLFELEGNPEGEAAAGDDWEVLYNFGDNDGGSPFAFTGIVPDIATADVGDRVFTQGGSKDVSDVDQWKYTTGSTPDKNEITNAYAAAYNMPADTGPHKEGDLIVYFGLDRFANDGDAFAGFWFFQGEVGQTEPSAQGTGDFTGNHVAMRLNPDWVQGDPIELKFLPGDMFVIVNYPQGANAEPQIKIYQWDPNDADADKNFDSSEQTKPPKTLSSPLDLVFADAAAKCDGAGDKLACAITNSADLANSPEWDYTPKSGLATTLPQESIFEGGINVTALLGSTPCFASFLAETRSSTSQTAQLKDFVFGAFPVCGIDVEKSCAAELNDNGEDVDVTFFGSLENSGGSSYIAYLKDDQNGSSIDRVCIDVGVEGCQNGTPLNTADDDPNVDDLVLQADGSAYFPLLGGVTVRFEGSYSLTGLVPNPLTDTVMALAFGDVADVPASGEEPNPQEAIVSDSDGAECSYQTDPSLVVDKDCSIAFINGNTVEVTITGTVENTGDVLLSNMDVSDSDFGALVLEVGGVAVTELGVGETGSFTKTVSVPYADLSAIVTGPVDGVSTVALSHSDTVTAAGEVLNSQGTAFDDASNTDGADCDGSFTYGIGVAKDCDDVILEPNEDGQLVVKVKVTATVTNLGEEDLTGIVLSDDPAVVFESYPTTLEGGQTPAASFTVDGYYYPTSAIDLTDLTPLQFSDTASVEAVGAFSSGDPTASDDADCPLCPTPD